MLLHQFAWLARHSAGVQGKGMEKGATPYDCRFGARKGKGIRHVIRVVPCTDSNGSLQSALGLPILKVENVLPYPIPFQKNFTPIRCYVCGVVPECSFRGVFKFP